MIDHSHLSHILTSGNSAQVVKIVVLVLIVKLLQGGIFKVLEFLLASFHIRKFSSKVSHDTSKYKFRDGTIFGMT